MPTLPFWYQPKWKKPFLQWVFFIVVLSLMWIRYGIKAWKSFAITSFICIYIYKPVLIKCNMHKGRICPAVSSWEINISRLLWVTETETLQRGKEKVGGVSVCKEFTLGRAVCYSTWMKCVTEMYHKPTVWENYSISPVWFFAKPHLTTDVSRL